MIEFQRPPATSATSRLGCILLCIMQAAESTASADSVHFQPQHFLPISENGIRCDRVVSGEMMMADSKQGCGKNGRTCKWGEATRS